MEEDLVRSKHELEVLQNLYDQMQYFNQHLEAELCVLRRNSTRLELENQSLRDEIKKCTRGYNALVVFFCFVVAVSVMRFLFGT